MKDNITIIKDIFNKYGFKTIGFRYCDIPEYENVIFGYVSGGYSCITPDNILEYLVAKYPKEIDFATADWRSVGTTCAITIKTK
jgi:hypothetical protein